MAATHSESSIPSDNPTFEGGALIDNEKFAYDYLIRKGIPKGAAAGIGTIAETGIAVSRITEGSGLRARTVVIAAGIAKATSAVAATRTAEAIAEGGIATHVAVGMEAIMSCRSMTMSTYIINRCVIAIVAPRTIV
jgi:hypothetical protein